MKFSNTIEIEQPIEKVFVFFSRPENLPKWNYYIQSVVTTTTDVIGLGAQYHQVRQSDEQYFEITALMENQLFEMTSMPGTKPAAKRTTRFEFVRSKTRLIDEFELKTGFPGFLENLFKKRIERAVFGNLQKMKTLLEEGSVRLQDGRISEYRESK